MKSTRSSSSPLESLPAELFLAVAEYADFDARLALSATNSKCRTILMPTIFRSLRVTSDEDEANEVLALARKIGANVRAISFHGTAEPNPGNGDATASQNEQEESDERRRKLHHQEQILPLAAAELLSGQHLPNMTTLIVHLEFDFDNTNRSHDGVWDSRDDLCDGSSMYVFTVEETSKDMIDESEEEFPWRRLMAQTWAAVSQNKNITELVLKELVPKAVSPWFSTEWQQFLAQILVADIQIWGGDNGAGWEVGTLEGYMYFVSKMDEYFFKHMTSTKKLRLACYEHGPLGSQWIGVQDTMSLRPDCFPQLEHLRLEYVLICPELVPFFEPKSGTLKSVVLHECFACDDYHGRTSTPSSWANFFNGIRSSDPKWTSFDVTNDTTPPLTFKEWQASQHPKEEVGEPDAEQEPDEVKHVRADLARDPNRRLFLYATLTDKYGDRWPDHHGIVEHFQLGRDMEEFEKLATLMMRN